MQMQDLGKYLTNYEIIEITASILLNLKLIPNRREIEHLRTAQKLTANARSINFHFLF